MHAVLIPDRITIKYRGQYEAMIKGVEASLLSFWATGSGTWLVFPNAVSEELLADLIAADAAYVDPTGGDYIISQRETIYHESVYATWMIKKAALLGIVYYGTSQVGDEKRVLFSRSLTPSEVSQLEAHEALFFDADVEKDMEFGRKLMVEFSNENIQLGISQAGKTKVVRHAMAEVSDALFVGALLDAVDEARLIPSGDKDSVFITNARLLSFINKVEAHYGMSLSTSL